jgi:hypothetical protein
MQGVGEMKFLLVITIFNSSWGSSTTIGKFNDFESCLKSLEKAELVVKDGDGGYKLCIPEADADIHGRVKK